MTRARLLLAAVALALIGAVGVAVAATTGTTQTYTYTVPGTTVAIPARTYTQTVAIPTVTQTVTQTVTVGTTTTTPTTTSTPSAPTFESETAYTQTLPAFTPSRTVTVASASQLRSAVDGLRAGDLVKASAPFTVSGEFNIDAAPGAPAELDLRGVSFVGGSGIGSAVWMQGAANLLVEGGDITNPYEFGLNVHAARNVTWYGFSIHDTGASGLTMFPVDGDITGNDFAGTITRWGGNLAVDPHAEKGTGLHGALLADAVGSHAFSDNRLALDEHDGPTGAGVEIGDDDGSPIVGNTLYLRVKNLTKAAQQQVAGNAVQTFGDSPVGLHIPYLEASNIQGRAVLTFQSAPLASGVHVDYGRASGYALNPNLQDDLPQGTAWDTKAGATYADVSPAAG